MSDDVTTAVLVWDVIARRYPSAEAADERFHELQDEATAKGPGESNYSCWRVGDPVTGEGDTIIVCGAPEVLAEVMLGGEPLALSARSARQFIERRLAVCKPTDGQPVVQREHYGDRGAWLRDGGRMEQR